MLALCWRRLAPIKAVCCTHVAHILADVGPVDTNLGRHDVQLSVGPGLKTLMLNHEKPSILTAEMRPGCRRQGRENVRKIRFQGPFLHAEYPVNYTDNRGPFLEPLREHESGEPVGGRRQPYIRPGAPWPCPCRRRLGERGCAPCRRPLRVAKNQRVSRCFVLFAFFPIFRIWWFKMGQHGPR